jgi:hypothetical protein
MPNVFWDLPDLRRWNLLSFVGTIHAHCQARIRLISMRTMVVDNTFQGYQDISEFAARVRFGTQDSEPEIHSA